jgi:hypothetical protein
MIGDQRKCKKIQKKRTIIMKNEIQSKNILEYYRYEGKKYRISEIKFLIKNVNIIRLSKT